MVILVIPFGIRTWRVQQAASAAGQEIVGVTILFGDQAAEPFAALNHNAQ